MGGCHRTSFCSARLTTRTGLARGNEEEGKLGKRREAKSWMAGGLTPTALEQVLKSNYVNDEAVFRIGFSL